jgi:hypothetical protein
VVEEEFGIILPLNFVYRPLFDTRRFKQVSWKESVLSSGKALRGTADMLGSTGKSDLNLWTKDCRKLCM